MPGLYCLSCDVYIIDLISLCFLAGMHLDKWLSVHRETLDLRDRQLVLQQVINLVAAVHKDQLCLWGSFVGQSLGQAIAL